MVNTSKTPAARYRLADYYASTGRTNEELLVLLVRSSNLCRSGGGLAALDHAEGKVAEAHKRLDSVLARVPPNAVALVMKAQRVATENRPDEALDYAKAAIAADPQSAAAHFVLAAVREFRREVAEAIKSTARSCGSTRASAAQIAMSRLSLASGDAPAAVRYAEEPTGCPSSLDARVTLTRGLIAAGNLARAGTEVAGCPRAPNSAAVQAVNGALLARRNDLAAARRSFERALELPGFSTLSADSRT
jgi:tetratricopeptide (TPR) repeat protein